MSKRFYVSFSEVHESIFNSFSAGVWQKFAQITVSKRQMTSSIAPLGTIYEKYATRVPVTPDYHGYRGCPSGKNPFARHFKGEDGNLYSVGKVNNGRFRK